MSWNANKMMLGIILVVQHYYLREYVSSKEYEEIEMSHYHKNLCPFGNGLFSHKF